MYFLRSNSLLDILLYLLLSSGWIVGGYLLVRTVFQLRRQERLMGGLVVGFLLFISLGNLLSHQLPVTSAFWVGSLVILTTGVACAWRKKLIFWKEKHDFRSFPLLLSLVAITALFTLILWGESIFDEYLHLPLISVMAAGEIPPHFYLNPDFYFAYHYGIQVYAGSLVRLAGLFPWSAWDVSRAVAIAFTLVLGWLWVRRVTRSQAAAWFGTVLFTFGGGSRWLLLLIPAGLLAWLSQSISLVGSGYDTAPTLIQALHKTWSIEGAGLVSFPFAFHNGIFVPVVFNLGSTGALPFMTVLLLLLLLPRRRFTSMGLLVWCLIFSTLALSAEHFFAVIWIGISLAMAISLLFHKKLFTSFPRGILIQWGIVLTLTAFLSVVQGGFISETARKLIATLAGVASQSYNTFGFSLRWPPALLSAHLGSLSILDPAQLIVLLAELGLALSLVIVIFTRFKKGLHHKDFFLPGLEISVVLSLAFPLFFQYQVDRSITRMPASALWTSLVLGFPILWMAYHHQKSLVRFGLVLGYATILLGGVMIFWSQLSTIPHTELSYYIDDLDASYAVDYWNKLPADSQVLDRIPERSVTIFGRISRSKAGIYEPLTQWEELIYHPVPAQIAASGYDYVYMDRVWWDNLTYAQQQVFLHPCIDVLDERKQDLISDYRLLVNVSACKD